MKGVTDDSKVGTQSHARIALRERVFVANRILSLPMPSTRQLFWANQLCMRDRFDLTNQTHECVF